MELVSQVVDCGSRSTEEGEGSGNDGRAAYKAMIHEPWEVTLS